MQFPSEPTHIPLTRIVHDLSQPLNALLAAARVLRSATSQATIDRASTTIERQAAYMHELIGKLLYDRRHGAGAATAFESVDICEIVAEVLDASQALCATHRLDASAILPGIPLRVAGDPVSLREILWNLISNAVRHTLPGGRIVVHVTSRGREVLISVSDTGTGLETDEIAAILRAFAEGAHTREGRRGFGLAVVWELARAHGGAIDVRSAGRGRGSEFVVMLPASCASMKRLDQAPGDPRSLVAT